MGCHPNIDVSRGKWPKQGAHLGQDVQVCFHYDTSTEHRGKIVRDDAEDPFITIIRLGSGQLVLATECQYRPADGVTLR